MLSFAAEKPISLHSAAQYAEVDYHTVYRWITKGVCGRKLEARKIGGSLRTTKEAIDRFSSGGQSPGAITVPRGPIIPADYAAAMQEFERLGVSSKGGSRGGGRQAKAAG